MTTTYTSVLTISDTLDEGKKEYAHLDATIMTILISYKT